MNQPRIAFINDVTGAKGSGCQMLWSLAAQSLHRAGQAEVLLAFREGAQPDLPTVRELLDTGAKAFFPRQPSRVSRAIRRVFSPRPATMERRCIAWLTQQNTALAVVCQSGYSGSELWWQALAEAGISYVTLSQCVDISMWFSDEHQVRLRDAYLNATGNFFVSRGNQRLAETMLGVPIPRAAIVCNPYRVAHDQPFTWPAQDDPWRLACVGRLFPWAKGQDLLLHALAGERWRSRDFRLTLVGAGPCREGLVRLAQTLELTDKVEFAGWVEDVAGIWKDHHALVLPSRYEGMPLAVLEALLCGRPCIVTDVAGNAEFITDGENGFLAEAPTRTAVDAALERAWRRRAEGEAMGRKAWERARIQIPRDPGGELAVRLVSLIQGKEDARDE